MADLEAEARSGSSGTTSEDELSEVLDDDKLPGDFPPERPRGSFDYGVTAQEQRVPEPIDERVEREEPDVFEEEGRRTAGDEGAVGRLVAPDEGVHVDDEATAVASEVDRVAADDLPVGDVGTGDTTTYDTATERAEDLSAEEAAVHEREVP